MNESTGLEGQQGTIPEPEARRRLVVGFGMVAHKLVERVMGGVVVRIPLR